MKDPGPNPCSANCCFCWFSEKENSCSKKEIKKMKDHVKKEHKYLKFRRKNDKK